MPRLPRAFLSICVFALVHAEVCLAQDAHDDAAARAEFQRSGRSARGEEPSYLLHRAYEQKMAMREARQTLSRTSGPSAKAQPGNADAGAFSSLLWHPMGPAPLTYDPTNFSAYGLVTGRVTAIAVDQRDSTGNTVYVGAASGGVWKSTNAAVSDASSVIWTPLTDGQASLAVGAIALQPAGSVILVGTGEANGSPDSYYGQGILRSTDGGQTWALVSSSDNGAHSLRGLGFARIAFSSTSPNLVVAAATATNAALPESNGGETQGATGRGIYYSTDAGLTWSYANVSDPAGVVEPTGATDVVYDAQHARFYAAVRGHGYYSSTDGATWTRLTSQPGTVDSSGLCPTTPANVACPLYRGSLSVNQATGEVFTVLVDSAGQSTSAGGGIFMLSAAGGAWTQLSQAGLDACGDVTGCGTQQGTYNLYVTAVPAVAGTDLYVGAVNTFKCSRTPANPTCANPGSWLNLTHVYGCSPLAAMSGMHPDQHAADFSMASSPTRLYFGNDGGLWRALDGSALTSSSCGAQNPFQNLNSTLGSLSAFVAFSQHPSDPGILLGGLQDNGSPALVPGNSGVNGLLWQGLNDTDGGYGAIDPVTPSLFYTSFSGVSVQRCTAGIACNRGSWTNVVSAGDVGGDGAAFYPPWTLDPQNSSQLVIGTCRVWRGAAAGGGYAAVSYNFSTGDTAKCSGGTTSGDTKVRSLAMGGPASSNGSQVIYAGLMGAAPLNGHIFVTTNADGGPATWSDRTGSINPSGYDISDIAISPADTTGHTAYLTIMGFGTAHVYKTTDAGFTWIDSSGNLPDAPANTIALDPDTPGTLYVGTDAGVFVSSDDGASWQELGASLPNAPVVRLKIFSAGGAKKLRAATYGRGMWQVDMVGGLSIQPTTMSFAAVVGRTSAPQTVALTNDSSDTVTISTISASSDFNVTNDCPIFLTAGSSCRVTLIFRPRVAGDDSTFLIVNTSLGVKTLSLSAQGVDFSLNATGPRPTRGPRAHVIVSVARGQSTDFDLPISVENQRAASFLGQTEMKVSCAGATAPLDCSVMQSADLVKNPMVHLRFENRGSAERSRRLRSGGLQTIQVSAFFAGVVRSTFLIVEVR